MINLSNYFSKNSYRSNRNFLIKTIVHLIGLYQSVFSGRTSTCRFIPSCSSYAIESFDKKGLFKGFFLTIKRIIRCNPWGGYGFDPVPENKRRLNV